MGNAIIWQQVIIVLKQQQRARLGKVAVCPALVPDNESSEEEQDTPHLKDQAGHPESSAEDPLDRTSGLIPEEEPLGVSEEVLESAGASRRTMAQCVSTGLKSEAYS